MQGVGAPSPSDEWSDEEIQRQLARDERERERAEAREEARLENARLQEKPDRWSDFDNSEGEMDEEEQVCDVTVDFIVEGHNLRGTWVT